MMLKLIHVALACVAFANGQSDQSGENGLNGLDKNPNVVTAGDVTVKFQGVSGGFKIYPDGQERSNFVKVEQSHLQEVSASGEIVKSWNPANGDWGDVESTSVLGKEAYSLTFQKSDEGVDFAVSFWISEVDATVYDPIVNATVALTQGQLKFSISIDNWVFNDTNNTLLYAITVEDKDGDEGEETGTDAGMAEFMYGRHKIVAPTVAMADGIQVNISVIAANSTLLFEFPSFATSVAYDPDVVVDKTITDDCSISFVAQNGVEIRLPNEPPSYVPVAELPCNLATGYSLLAGNGLFPVDIMASNGERFSLNPMPNKLGGEDHYYRWIPAQSCLVLGCQMLDWVYQDLPATGSCFLTPALAGGACYCDDACTYYRDCCYDYSWTCSVGHHPSNSWYGVVEANYGSPPELQEAYEALVPESLLVETVPGQMYSYPVGATTGR